MLCHSAPTKGVRGMNKSNMAKFEFHVKLAEDKYSIVILLMEEFLHQLIGSVCKYLRVAYIPGAAGFLPSTVGWNFGDHLAILIPSNRLLVSIPHIDHCK